MDEQQLYILIGELKSGQAAVRGAVETLTESTNSLRDTMNGLPCADHSGEIKTLMEWKGKCNGTAQATQIEQLKGTISLKNGIILIIITAVITGAATKIIDLIAR